MQIKKREDPHAIANEIQQRDQSQIQEGNPDLSGVLAPCQVGKLAVIKPGILSEVIVTRPHWFLSNNHAGTQTMFRKEGEISRLCWKMKGFLLQTESALKLSPHLGNSWMACFSRENHLNPVGRGSTFCVQD